MHDDGLPHLRDSLRRSTALRTAQGSPQPHLVQMPPPAQFFAAPEPTRLSFWQVTLRAIPIIVALVSTSLLAYFLITERSQLLAQLQQDPPPQTPQQQPQPTERMAQQEAPPQHAQPQRQPEPPAQRLPMPPDDVLLMLIRSSLIALNQANVTGNYTVFRELSAPGFQEANSAAKLAEVFADLRNRQFDLSPILLIEPKLFSKPEMSPNGKLRMTGFFPSEPERINFDFIFQPVQGHWRLFGVRVKTTPASPVATVPEPPAGEASSSELPPAPKAAAPAKPAPQAAKPAAPARKAADKPKPVETDETAASPPPDVRDRLDNPPAPPPAAKPKQKGGWNPFGR